MTHQEKIQKIREVCIKANLEIENRNDYIIDDFTNQLSQAPITEDWFNSASEDIRNVMKDILYGCVSPVISLEDILGAKYFSMPMQRSILSRWKFGKPLKDQLEPTINFLYEIFYGK